MMSHEKESFLYKPSNPKIPGVSLILTLFRPNFDLDSQKKKEETLSSPLFLYFSTLSIRTLLILLFRYRVGLGFDR